MAAFLSTAWAILSRSPLLCLTVTAFGVVHGLLVWTAESPVAAHSGLLVFELAILLVLLVESSAVASDDYETDCDDGCRFIPPEVAFRLRRDVAESVHRQLAMFATPGGPCRFCGRSAKSGTGRCVTAIGGDVLQPKVALVHVFYVCGECLSRPDSDWRVGHLASRYVKTWPDQADVRLVRISEKSAV